MATVARATGVCCTFMVVLSIFWVKANGLCMPEHPQTIVCRSMYVVRVKVISTDWERDSRTTRAPTTTAAKTTRRPPLTLPRPEQGETDFVLGKKPDEKLLEVFRKGGVIVKEEDTLLEPGYLPWSRPKVIRLELEKLYKGAKKLPNLKGHHFSVTFTGRKPAPVAVGEVYIWTGFAIGKRLYANDCGWISKWENLSEVQRMGLKRFYWLYCRCEVRFCPRCKKSRRTCDWNPSFDEIGMEKTDFLSKEKVCMVTCQKCEWFNPGERPSCNYGR